MQSSLVTLIDALLPQTQCRQCLYADCRGYAEALASGAADTDRCPPGGATTAAALARLLGRPAKPVDPMYGATKDPQVAWVDESRCIGCALCLPACPVDAIIGAKKFMHTVITAQCTGCELCLPPCPVDCIELRPLVEGDTNAGLALRRTRADDWRDRHDRHRQRLAHAAANERAAFDAARRVVRPTTPE